METNPYIPTLADQLDGRTNRRRKPGWWARSGAWIGLLSVGIGIAIAVWLLDRIPVEVTDRRVLVFVGLVACPYLILGVVSCLVSSLPAKSLLVVALMALVVTTIWQFSIRDAQAAMIIVFQFPGVIIMGVLAVIINVFTKSR